MHITDAVIHLLLKQPFYGHMASSLTFHESGQVEQIQTLTSPYPRVLYNGAWYGALGENEAIGVLIHELLHLILLHPFRRGGRDASLWAIACDMAVNEHIHPHLLPKSYITVQKIQSEIKLTLEPSKSAESYYDSLVQAGDSLQFISRNNKVTVLLKSGHELMAERFDEDNHSEMDRETVTRMISDLVSDASEDGNIPSALEGFVKENFHAGHVNWRNVLKRFLSGTGRMLVRKSYKKASKRYDNMPGNKRSIGLKALLAIDESGSISTQDIEAFFAEMMRIKRITGAAISVTRFDTQCSEPEPIDRYLRSKARLKNGGTDFRPVFELAEKLRIPLVVLFTDGDGNMPEKAGQKVLWVLTKEVKKPLPFGESILFEKEL
ncbi:MAG: VWA-like domain-containing protein [Clostridia bacterium]|nr:VWA-like domain-containing protein [Clostridia bacterium]